jgi:hypothetical protein
MTLILSIVSSNVVSLAFAFRFSCSFSVRHCALIFFCVSFSFSVSPSNDHALRVSDQLNTLRTLLESRLNDHVDTRRTAKDLSTLQSSPATFAKEFLRSYPKTNSDKHSSNVISDVDDDNENSFRRDTFECDLPLTSTTALFDRHADRFHSSNLSNLTDCHRLNDEHRETPGKHCVQPTPIDARR